MKPRYCSFCGKAEHEIFYLVEGPTVFICDECVVLAADVVQNQRARKARGEAVQRGPRNWMARHYSDEGDRRRRVVVAIRKLKL